MNDTRGAIRRCALLQFPSNCLNRETIQTIAAEGYTDVGTGIGMGGLQQRGAGFSFEQVCEINEMIMEVGLGLVAFTGYMKYNEEAIIKEPERRMICFGEGVHLDSDGLLSRWQCPFQPKNKSIYINLLKEIADLSSTREIHLNDEASLSLGNALACYCNHCCETFETSSGSPPPRELNKDDPLWWTWTEFRMETWSEVHREFREEIHKVNPEILVGFQHSSYPCMFHKNPGLTAINLGRDAQTLDVLCTDPYHFIHAGIYNIQPHRRLLPEATRTLAGACLDDTPMNIYPQAFMPPAKSTPMGRQDGLFAGTIPFALGAKSITPYSYELAKIIPGFHEALLETRKLESEFEKATPYAFATVINPLQSEVRGHPESNWGSWYLFELMNVMYRTGLPWRWFSDQRLDDAAVKLRGPVIVPDAHCLTGPQLAAVKEVANRGEGILWIGNTPQEPWSGEGACPLPHEFERGEFELTISEDHLVIKDICTPVMLQSHTHWAGPEGHAVATVDGRPGLVLIEGEQGREAWLTGLPIHSHQVKELHGAIKEPSGGVDLIKRLLLWLSPKVPTARLDPYPPVDDYVTLRPWDIRGVPTAEMFPLLQTDNALLAIVFPYTPVRFSTSLVFNLPGGSKPTSVKDLWYDTELSGEVITGENGEYRLPLKMPGDFEMLAIRVEYSSEP